jgi:hypothetical protein
MSKNRIFSFGFTTSRDHLNKLARDVDRLEQAESRDDKSDHAINGAITAWHLHEWAWADMKAVQGSELPDFSELGADTAEQARLHHKERQQACRQVLVDVAKELAIGAREVDAKAFGAYMAKRHPAIEACRIIATGSKHIGVGHLPSTDVETFVSGPSSTLVEMAYFGVPKITMSGLTRGASDVLREASQVWTDFIYRRDIG